MEQSELSAIAQSCLQSLMRVWFDFERQLNQVDLLRKLEREKFEIEDYRRLILNLRQQVIEGSRWISRCASSFDRNYSDVRSIVIQHAKSEHLDYQLLEQDYLSVGGNLEEIQSFPKNLGSEALHSFMMHRASQENPVDLIGAMWIIEGVGQKMTSEWSQKIDRLLKLNGRGTKFMQYHAENDSAHMDQLYQLLDRVCEDSSKAEDIVKTARIVGKLYIMQLDEIDND